MNRVERREKEEIACHRWSVRRVFFFEEHLQSIYFLDCGLNKLRKRFKKVYYMISLLGGAVHRNRRTAPNAIINVHTHTVEKITLFEYISSACHLWCYHTAGREPHTKYMIPSRAMRSMIPSWLCNILKEVLLQFLEMMSVNIDRSYNSSRAKIDKLPPRLRDGGEVKHKYE